MVLLEEAQRWARAHQAGDCTAIQMYSEARGGRGPFGWELYSNAKLLRCEGMQGGVQLGTVKQRTLLRCEGRQGVVQLGTVKRCSIFLELRGGRRPFGWEL